MEHNTETPSMRRMHRLPPLELGPEDPRPRTSRSGQTARSGRSNSHSGRSNSRSRSPKGEGLAGLSRSAALRREAEAGTSTAAEAGRDARRAPAVMALWERGGSWRERDSLPAESGGAPRGPDAPSGRSANRSSSNLRQRPASTGQPPPGALPAADPAANGHRSGRCACDCHCGSRSGAQTGRSGREPQRSPLDDARSPTFGSRRAGPGDGAATARGRDEADTSAAADSARSADKRLSWYRRNANAVNLSIVAVIAISFGLAKFFLSRYDEARLVGEHFQETSQVVTSAIRTSLDQLEVFVSMMSNHLGSAEIRADDVAGAIDAFKKFTGPQSLWHSTDIATVSLVKRVPHSERATMEAFSGKKFVERQTTGPPAVSNDHADYFPIIAIHPFSESAYMLDVGAPSEGARRSLIYTCRDTGGFTYTGALKLVQFDYRIGVALQSPLYVTASGVITPLKSLSKAFYGLITGTAKLWEVLESTREYRKSDLIDIDLFLFRNINEDPPAWEFLGMSRGEGSLPGAYDTTEKAQRATPEAILASGDVSRAVHLSMGENARWQLLIVARRGYISARQSAVIPTAFLLLSLFGTICSNFLAIYFLIRIGIRSIVRWRAGGPHAPRGPRRRGCLRRRGRAGAAPGAGAEAALPAPASGRAAGDPPSPRGAGVSATARGEPERERERERDRRRPPPSGSGASFPRGGTVAPAPAP
eukprot:tig00021105_g18242.t1